MRGEDGVTSRRDATARAVRLSEAALVASLLLLAALAWLLSDRLASPHMRLGPLTGAGSGAVALAGESMAARPSLVAIGLFLGTWTVMMAAMMFPALIPVVLTFHRWIRRVDRSRWHSLWFVAGYLAVWVASGGFAYLAVAYLAPLLSAGEAAVRWGAALLVAAGVYQFTSLKDVCLKHCRSPLAFVAQHATALRRGGVTGARVGAVHGIFCLGCCWALMLVLVLLGMMSLTWMAAVAGVILLEKVLPRGWPVRRAVGVVLVGAGVFLLVWPRTLPAFG